MQNKQWAKGGWHYINKMIWDESEQRMIDDVLREDWFGDGKFTKELEGELIKFSGHAYAQLTNSGSSAINLAVQTLIQKRIWQPGDLILHPINTFATSISSAIMAGLIPVYVDTDEGTYVASLEQIKRALNEYPQIKGAIIPALLGNIMDVVKLRKLLGDRILILDSCDVMGTKWDGREISSYGDFAAYSFYGSHHISSFGVGGALVTSNQEWYRTANSMTFWGRDVLNQHLPGVENFLKRYTYETLGTDSQMTAVQAGFALAQIKRLDFYIEKRRSLFNELNQLFSKYSQWFILPKSGNDTISWFCYPLVIKENAPFTRYDFVKYLLDNRVETRPIMCGDITKQPPFRYAKSRIIRPIINATRTEQAGFFITACPMSDEQKADYLGILQRFLESYESQRNSTGVQSV